MRSVGFVKSAVIINYERSNNMKLPKIKIDYSKAWSGDAPFDGSRVLGHDYMGRIHEISYCDFSNRWETDYGDTYSQAKFTHYTPMPEFEEVQESNQHAEKGELISSGKVKWFKKWPVKGGEK